MTQIGKQAWSNLKIDFRILMVFDSLKRSFQKYVRFVPAMVQCRNKNCKAFIHLAPQVWGEFHFKIYSTNFFTIQNQADLITVFDSSQHWLSKTIIKSA